MPSVTAPLIPKWTKHVAAELGGRDPLGLSRVSFVITDYLLTGIVTVTSRARLLEPYKQQGLFAPRTLLRFTASTDPAESLSPSTDFPVLPVIRLPCSADFATGRGGFLQLLSMTLSPCCPYQPRRSVASLQFVQRSMLPSPEKCGLGLRSMSFRGHTGSLALRPGDSLTILMRSACPVDPGPRSPVVLIRPEGTQLVLQIASIAARVRDTRRRLDSWIEDRKQEYFNI